MKFWVGVTDNQWFNYLSEAKLDEVNFWQPSATPPFTNAPMGLPFLFKLKRPFNHIAGGGFFVTYSKLPLDIAWEVFGQKNGCSSLDDLRRLISPLTAENTLAILEVAHIVTYSGEGGHDVQNGLLLRADFHRLFDVGLVSVTPDLKIRVSPRIRESWFNGKVYYQLDNKHLTVVPDIPSMRPDPDRLNWHFKNRFQN